MTFLPSYRRTIASTLSFGLLAVLSGCDNVQESVRTTVHSTVEAITPSRPPARDIDFLHREPDVRVRIARQSTTQTLSGPERFVVRPTSGTASSPTTRVRVMTGPVTISSGDRGIRTVDGAGESHDWGFGVDLDVLASDGTPDGAAEAPSESIHLGERLIPGYLTVRPTWNENPSRFDTVATMPVESYLPGVLGRELIKSWPRQAFEAQSIAARTYALQERQRARGEGKAVDVEDTTSDQVFGGTSGLTVAVEAVRATRGWVMTDQGALIRAYFSSQCGGRPASAAEAWTTGTVPSFNKVSCLQGTPRSTYCQSSPLYRWTATRTVDDVTRRLRAWGKSKGNDLSNITRVRRIEIKDRNAAQRPSRFTITSDAGRDYVLAAEELREAFNTSAPGLPPITRENRLNSADVQISIFADDVRITGRGFGHGVGMCQWCAKGMAESGMDWRSMIEQFYPGVDVRKLY
jgi:stage II sporulation protein D